MEVLLIINVYSQLLIISVTYPFHLLDVVFSNSLETYLIPSKTRKFELKLGSLRAFGKPNVEQVEGIVLTLKTDTQLTSSSWRVHPIQNLFYTKYSQTIISETRTQQFRKRYGTSPISAILTKRISCYIPFSFRSSPHNHIIHNTTPVADRNPALPFSAFSQPKILASCNVQTSQQSPTFSCSSLPCILHEKYRRLKSAERNGFRRYRYTEHLTDFHPHINSF